MTSGEVGTRPAMPRSVTLGSRYTLRRKIGTGGYSEVWEAHDTVLDRPVAVKLLHAEHARHAETLLRFRTEAQLAARLSDANLARVYDFSDTASDGTPYLVMEFVDGPTLAQVLRRGPLTPAATMDMLAQAASGLRAAHAAGMVHRDIKPSNIMLAPGNVVKITDFGLSHTLASAPITRSGMVAGTPGFMAPERAAGVRATAASDLYALGVVGYECLAGLPPFEGTPIEVALAHRDYEFPPLPVSTPRPVAGLIAHLTAKDPADRPASAGLVAGAAAELRDTLPAAPPGRDELTPPLTSPPGQTHRTLIVPVPDAGVEPEPDRVRRGPTAAVGWLLAAALGLAAAIAIVVIALAHRPSPPAATTGQQRAPTSRAVDVSRSALVGEPAPQAYRQLHAEGFRVRVQWQPSQQQPGTVLAVRPAGPQQSGSLITLVAAIHGRHKGHDGNGNGNGGDGGGDNG
jgi:tRNA A-37 threonylcarbamoyl transferase component Bud32